MKVLLEQDVKGTGKKGEIVNVSDGYGRNFLLPRKLATPADTASINAANIKKAAAQHKKVQEGVKARDLAKTLSGLTVKVQAKAGENGKLFGAITSKEIAQALEAQHGIALDRKKIVLNDPIKTLTTVEVVAKVYENVDAKFKVQVVAQ